MLEAKDTVMKELKYDSGLVLKLNITDRDIAETQAEITWEARNPEIEAAYKAGIEQEHKVMIGVAVDEGNKAFEAGKKQINSGLYEACKEVVKAYKCSPTSMQPLFWLRCLQALASADKK